MKQGTLILTFSCGISLTMVDSNWNPQNFCMNISLTVVLVCSMWVIGQDACSLGATLNHSLYMQFFNMCLGFLALDVV